MRPSILNRGLADVPDNPHVKRCHCDFTLYAAVSLSLDTDFPLRILWSRTRRSLLVVLSDIFSRLVVIPYAPALLLSKMTYRMSWECTRFSTIGARAEIGFRTESSYKLCILRYDRKTRSWRPVTAEEGFYPGDDVAGRMGTGSCRHLLTPELLQEEPYHTTASSGRPSGDILPQSSGS